MLPKMIFPLALGMLLTGALNTLTVKFQVLTHLSTQCAT